MLTQCVIYVFFFGLLGFTCVTVSFRTHHLALQPRKRYVLFHVDYDSDETQESQDKIALVVLEITYCLNPC